MSYGLHSYAVSLQTLRSAIGKRRTGFFRGLWGTPADKLIATLIRKFADRLADDEIDEDDEEEPTLEKALVDLVKGNGLSPHYGHKYGYALEILCHHFGQRLDNSAWSGIHWAWGEEIRDAMVKVGIDKDVVTTNHLLLRGSPIPIPSPDDFPSIGYVLKSELGDAVQQVASADLSALNSEVTESINQVLIWLRHCQNLDSDLVCFYY